MARTEADIPREVKRVQIDMPTKSFERLKKLVVTTEASSYAEVMKNALRLYEALIAEHEAGHKIFVKTNDGMHQIKIFSS